MRNLTRLTVVIILMAINFGALAQSEEEGPEIFTYATYFYCDVTRQERADEIVRTQNAPVYDQLVKDGVITAWGWMAHHTGGKWRRVQYYQAPSVNGLLDAQTEMNKRLDAENKDPDNEFGKICNAHDDYIWKAEGGTAGKSRGAAGFSVYYKCEETKEERADEIWEKDFAPILNKFVADGKFTSWGWLSHVVGGEFRRLQTMTGSDHKSLMTARGELIEAMYGNDNASGAEFTAICGSHSDYMWDIQLETP